MSNLTYIRTRIRNREHLISALKSLSFQIIEGSSLTVSNRYETRSVDFLAMEPGSGRNIGFFIDSTGDFSMAGDYIVGVNLDAIQTEVTKIENRIKREYAKSVVKEKLLAQGFFLESESENNESIVIKLSRIV